MCCVGSAGPKPGLIARVVSGRASDIKKKTTKKPCMHDMLFYCGRA